ncbi:hypothetical protein N0V84_005615 [Fusarium piperis]|uniref:Uncharacterized protein n=1 Tax=Fusarium piperis TaxID=1435070 RepID=A0A9W8WDM2_9HYPO|nr:hypothetical protein N0V84_005615 [Fusarium piperis]
MKGATTINTVENIFILAGILKGAEKKFRPIIERLQRRGKKMATMYIAKTTWGYHLRNLVLKVMPSSWIASWHVSSAKVEIDLTTVKI